MDLLNSIMKFLGLGAVGPKRKNVRNPDIPVSHRTVIHKGGSEVRITRVITDRDFQADARFKRKYPNGYSHARQTARHRTANVEQANAVYDRCVARLDQKGAL
jgi:hypothetical protein